jgi:hypothetical protein
MVSWGVGGVIGGTGELLALLVLLVCFCCCYCWLLVVVVGCCWLLLLLVGGWWEPGAGSSWERGAWRTRGGDGQAVGRR